MSSDTNHLIGGVAAGLLLGFGLTVQGLAAKADQATERRVTAAVEVYEQCDYVVPEMGEAPSNWKKITILPNDRWCVKTAK